MTVNNTSYDEFRTIHNSAFIGFDELFRKIKELEKPQTGFPPYDIIKESDDDFVIKLAVAGYSKDQIKVALDSGKLSISGSLTSQTTDKPIPIDYIYKGIAERDFKRIFTLADTVQVEKVKLVDGMLFVHLKNVIPESQKPKLFCIE